MRHHGPSCLDGPVSRTHDWWSTPTPDHPEPAQDPSRAPADDPEIRRHLVEQIRREIALGTYETPERWDVALDRLLRHLEQD